MYSFFNVFYLLFSLISHENSFFCRKIINATIVLVLEIDKKQNDVEDKDEDVMKTG
jgi:hypothetical protein